MNTAERIAELAKTDPVGAFARIDEEKTESRPKNDEGLDADVIEFADGSELLHEHPYGTLTVI